MIPGMAAVTFHAYAMAADGSTMDGQTGLVCHSDLRTWQVYCPVALETLHQQLPCRG